MEYRIRQNCENVDWQQVHDILKRVGMGTGGPDKLKKAFLASYVTTFAYKETQLIGFARAISDGVCNAAIYDVAVTPECQRTGVGASLLRSLLGRLENLNVILFATPGMENFYLGLGLRRMKTGMARFVDADYMSGRGFTEVP